MPLTRLFSGSNGDLRWALALYVTPILSRVNSPLFMKSALTWWRQEERDGVNIRKWQRRINRGRREGREFKCSPDEEMTAIKTEWKWDDQLNPHYLQKLCSQPAQLSGTDIFRALLPDRRERRRRIKHRKQFIHSWVNVSSLVTHRANFLSLTPSSILLFHTDRAHSHHHLVSTTSTLKAWEGTVLWPKALTSNLIQGQSCLYSGTKHLQPCDITAKGTPGTAPMPSSQCEWMSITHTDINQQNGP